MDGPGNGAGRVIGVNIVGVEVLVHSHRAYDRQEILLQQVVENLGIHIRHLAHETDVLALGILLLHLQETAVLAA